MYDDIKKILLFPFAVVESLFYIKELKKEIERIKTIKIGFQDENIEAIVIGFLYFRMDSVKPILQYTINGIQKQYTYHFCCSSSKYLKGEKVVLKISKESELAYDKTDIIKAILFDLMGAAFGIAYLIITVWNFFRRVQ